MRLFKVLSQSMRFLTKTPCRYINIFKDKKELKLNEEDVVYFMESDDEDYDENDKPDILKAEDLDCSKNVVFTELFIEENPHFEKLDYKKLFKQMKNKYKPLLFVNGDPILPTCPQSFFILSVFQFIPKPYYFVNVEKTRYLKNLFLKNNSPDYEPFVFAHDFEGNCEQLEYFLAHNEYLEKEKINELLDKQQGDGQEYDYDDIEEEEESKESKQFKSRKEYRHQFRDFDKKEIMDFQNDNKLDYEIDDDMDFDEDDFDEDDFEEDDLEEVNKKK